MSIEENPEKINPVVNFDIAKNTLRAEPNVKIYYRVKPFYTPILIVVIASIFFALGRLSALEERKTPIQITYPNGSTATTTLTPVTSNVANISSADGANTVSDGAVIGSKNGKKYYFPWCGTVKMIKPENQIHFASIEEARSAGYTPAANCKGLK